MRRPSGGSGLALLAALAIVLVVALGAMAASSVLVVRVASEEGPSFVLPVPLALAAATLLVAPRLEVSGVGRHHADLEPALLALTHAPDGVYLEAVQGSERMTIEKRARVLHIVATGSPGTAVELTLPLPALGTLLRAYDTEAGEVSRRRLLPLLWGIPRGPILHLEDEAMEVQVGVWRPW